MMKQLTSFALVILMIVPLLFTGCKKGENDPLSFKSRKARMVGTWLVSSILVDGDEMYNTTEKEEESAGSCGTKTTTTEMDVETQYIFQEDGDYEMEQEGEITTTVTYSDPSCSSMETENEFPIEGEMEGRWTFAGGVDDIKSKEQLLLMDEDDNPTQIVTLLRLSSKEIIYTYEDVNGDDVEVTLIAAN